MNLVDAYVTKVVATPYEAYGKYFVDVEYDSYGAVSKTSIMFSTMEEAEAVDVDYKFLT